jgi:hypothetical protein
LLDHIRTAVGGIFGTALKTLRPAAWDAMRRCAEPNSRPSGDDLGPETATVALFHMR